jgi:hypothetical protein
VNSRGRHRDDVDLVAAATLALQRRSRLENDDHRRL